MNDAIFRKIYRKCEKMRRYQACNNLRKTELFNITYSFGNRDKKHSNTHV